MSWMTPVSAGLVSGGSDIVRPSPAVLGVGALRGAPAVVVAVVAVVVGEELGDPVPALFQPTRPRPSPATVSRMVSYVDSSASRTSSRCEPSGWASTPAAARRSRTAVPGSEPIAPGSRPWSSGKSVTSTARTAVASVKEAVEEERSNLPPSMTTRWSQVRSSSPSRWVVTSTEMPKSECTRRISASISSRPAGSRPLVGSSSSTNFGSWTSAWASLTRCFMPVEYPPIGRYRSS